MISLQTQSPWRTKIVSSYEVRYAGQIDSWENVAATLIKCNKYDREVRLALSELLAEQKSCFGMIISRNQQLLAISDQVRSYPVFYATSKSEKLVSTSSRITSFERLRVSVCEEAVQEFLLCGYVLGSRTLYNQLHQLQAGHYLWSNDLNKELMVEKYYEYLPVVDATESSIDFVEKFNQALDISFERLIRNLDGRPAWIPLSGGLDSRLVLCKLMEHKYDRIFTFSYGVNNNHEMRMAKFVAKKLGVSWIAVPSKLENLKKLYCSETRKNYADYSDGFNCVPTYLDFEAIDSLKKSQIIPNDAVIVNGYSGDFLFGGHVPQQLVDDPSIDNLVEQIIAKHCSHINTPEFARIKNALRIRIREECLGHCPEFVGREQICALYEHWDWKERQVKAVVNGQRVYEHFDLDWCLPLWDLDLMNFWSTVPVDQKYRQSLHLTFLKEYNFRGAFVKLRSSNELWIPHWNWMPYVGTILGIVAGKKTKQQFYEYMFYFGYFRNQLGLFGFDSYKNYYKKIRRPRVVPIAAIYRLNELNLSSYLPGSLQPH